MSLGLTIGVASLALGLVLLLLTLRPDEGGPPQSDDHGSDDGGGGGGGGRQDPPRPSPTGDPEPEWWPDFEREFATYVAASVPAARQPPA